MTKTEAIEHCEDIIQVARDLYWMIKDIKAVDLKKNLDMDQFERHLATAEGTLVDIRHDFLRPTCLRRRKSW